MTDKNLAVDFATGALSPQERIDVMRQRLSDPILDAEIDHHEAMLAPLAGVAGEIAPPLGLKDRVIAAIIAAEQGSGDGKQMNTFEAGDWRALFPGVTIKRLWPKGPKLMRCEPGSVIPAHEHDEHEHLFVVSGDFLLEGQRFRVGDHLSSPAGSRHEEGTTRTGCILLLNV
jgi:hypothetical protein